MELKTYGQQNFFRRHYNNLRNRFIINPRIRESLADRGIALYSPKLNKIKLTIAGLFFGICIVIPLIPIPLGALVFFNWGMR